jgi:hypothetical protein
VVSPADVAKLLQDTLDTQPTIIGQPNDNDLLALKEKLLDILQTICYDRGCKKLIHNAVEEVYTNELKDCTTYFHKVFAHVFLEHFAKNSTRIHALVIVTLCMNILLLYKNIVSMPDFILAMEEVQKKAKQVELPILDIKLAMYAGTSMLQMGDYKKETNKQDGYNVYKKIWKEWKQAYLAVYGRGVNC